MEKLDKKTYRGIVKFTLESMLNLSKTDKNYNLAADTIYYYENTIVPEGQLTTPTGKPVGFLLPSLACNRTSFSDFGIQV